MNDVSRLNITLLALLMCTSGCKLDHPLTGYYSDIRLGTDNTLLPKGHRSLTQPSLLSYFLYFRSDSLASATHFVRSSRFEPPLVAFYLESDLETGKLDRTVKTTKLMQGPFGNVSLKKSCFYHRSFDANLDTAAIGMYDSEAESATPAGEPPTRAGFPTSFALVRIYHDGGATAVLAGNYEADGTLRSLHLDHTRFGHRLLRQEDGVFIYPLSSIKVRNAPDPIALGLPLTIHTTSVVESMRFPAAPLPVVMNVLFTIYDEGSLIREDRLQNGQEGLAIREETLYLHTSVVDEQRQLEPSCNGQFAKQRATRMRTVE
jgi:hypothetical protein